MISKIDASSCNSFAFAFPDYCVDGDDLMRPLCEGKTIVGFSVTDAFAGRSNCGHLAIILVDTS